MKTFILSLLCALLLGPSPADASDRLFFVPLVEEYFDGGTQQTKQRVLLEWGAIEGEIPHEIEHFILYRQQGEADFAEIATTSPQQVMAAESLRTLILDDNDSLRFADLLEVLEDINSALESPWPTISEGNFHLFISELLDTTRDDHNPLQKMLLSRFNPAVAQAAGLAFVDEQVVSGEMYRYMLTAITAAGESLPIGKTAFFPLATPTILPAPSGLAQIRVAGCSSIRKNLDDLRIHFSWQVPDRPEEINLKILTYGYDLFWSETAQTLDPNALRGAIPTGLYRVNTKPVVAAGPPPESGPDSYLIRDFQENHRTGPAWKRGQKYYYYLAARDISGHYSYVSGPLEATVVDSQPPVAPWRVHTEEISTVVSGGTSLEPLSRIALVWDQVNSTNYSRYFGTDRAICSATTTEVCTASSAELCNQPENVRCADLDVQRYHILRFDSARKAAAWGTDSDGDLWPDELEEILGTSPCDASSVPAAENMPATHISLDKDSTSHIRDLSPPTHKQFYFIDTEVDPRNPDGDGPFGNVFYYRIFTEDSNGNFSQLSPPIRAVMHDRSQPVVAADLQTLDCRYYQTTHSTNLTKSALILRDITGDAQYYQVLQYCESTTHLVPPSQLISKGVMESDGDVYLRDLFRSCEGGVPTDIGVLFYENLTSAIAAIRIPMAATPTDNHGTVTLEGNCQWVGVNAPYQVSGGPVKACVELTAEESARVYYETDGEMSPVATIPYDPDPENGGRSCLELDNMASLVSTDLCTGIRVFSENHVGSGMTFFNCLELKQAKTSLPPPPPLMEDITARETVEPPGGQPYFEVSWSAPADGLAAFVILLESDETKRYRTLFPNSQRAHGQYMTELMLNPETDMGKEWCVQVRAISTAMQKSDWSQPSCAIWAEAVPDNLAWPTVTTPPETDQIKAFFINENPGYGRPALLLSTDFSAIISQSACVGAGSCADSVPVCDGTSNCITWVDDDDNTREDVTFTNPVPGRFIEKVLNTRNFILYRQEEGRDFVQVSPLVQDFSFQPFHYHPFECKTCTEVGYRLQDPFYFLRNFSPAAIGGLDGVSGIPIAPEEFEGMRMFFLDRYPYSMASTIRYKLVFLDPLSGEPKSITTSNWLTLP